MADVMDLPFTDWLPRQRWYAGRTRQLTGVAPRVAVPLGDQDGLGLDLVLLEASFVQGPPERYQVIVRWRDQPVDAYPAIATIGPAGGRIGYDALYDAEAARHLLELIATTTTRGETVFAAEPGVTLPVDAQPRMSGAEQSNTSVIFGRAAMLKVFRRVTAGINPDIELNRVLGRAGNRHVARLLGSVETSWDGEPFALAMVNEFAADATEGWDMAIAETRDLRADGDFSAEARRLGEAVASVHAGLSQQLGTQSVPFPQAVLSERLAAAADAVDQLRQHVPSIEALYRRLAGQQITVQRVHGDLHLGQVLRTAQGWLVIDFEGEPGQPLDERRRPDSPVRDVAGMLRSFDYAAHKWLAEGAGSGSVDAARAWVRRAEDAFCVGYAAVAGADPRDAADLLAAYELDKAIYEAAYEARYRPDWLPIPMGAISRLLS